VISTAPIPSDAIGLADAFQRVCIVRIPDWPEIQAAMQTASDALKEAVANRTDDLMTESRRQRDRAQKRAFYAKRDADLILREALGTGDIRAQIRNPQTGEVAEVSYRNEWTVDLPGADYDPGFSDNLVSEWRRPNPEGKRVLVEDPLPEQPGPPSHFGDGIRCPIFFQRASFEEWLTVECWDCVNLRAKTSMQKWLVEALLTVWPNGKVPANLSTAEVSMRIDPHFRSISKRATGKANTPPTASTVNRQIGREKMPSRGK
jgi:hypothetical protein